MRISARLLVSVLALTILGSIPEALAWEKKVSLGRETVSVRASPATLRGKITEVRNSPYFRRDGRDLYGIFDHPEELSQHDEVVVRVRWNGDFKHEVRLYTGILMLKQTKWWEDLTVAVDQVDYGVLLTFTSGDALVSKVESKCTTSGRIKVYHPEGRDF